MRKTLLPVHVLRPESHRTVLHESNYLQPLSMPPSVENPSLSAALQSNPSLHLKGILLISGREALSLL
jgi:hypothetical protein